MLKVIGEQYFQAIIQSKGNLEQKAGSHKSRIELEIKYRVTCHVWIIPQDFLIDV